MLMEIIFWYIPHELKTLENGNDRAYKLCQSGNKIPLHRSHNQRIMLKSNTNLMLLLIENHWNGNRRRVEKMAQSH